MTKENEIQISDERRHSRHLFFFFFFSLPHPTPTKRKRKDTTTTSLNNVPTPFLGCNQIFFRDEFFRRDRGISSITNCSPTLFELFLFLSCGWWVYFYRCPSKKKIEIESCCVGLEPLSRLVYYFTC